MAGNPREHEKGRGFWDGGLSGQSQDGQASGRHSGFPGKRTPSRIGLYTDLEQPLRKGEDPNDLNRNGDGDNIRGTDG